MALVILGNGYDQANGLPTSYKDYFNYRFNKIAKFINEYQRLINLDVYSEVFNPDDLDEIDSINSHFNSSERHEIIDKFRNEKNSFIDNQVRKLREIMDCFVDTEPISFWDLFFYHKFKKSKNIKNWCDVEKEISTYIHREYNYSNDDLFYSYYNLDYIRPDNRSNLEFNKIYSHITEGVNAIADLPVHGQERVRVLVDSEKNSDIFEKIIIYELFLKIRKNKGIKIHQILLDELNNFELSFSKYIMLIQEEIINPNLKSYIGNINDIIGRLESSEETEHFMINFNYSRFDCINNEKKNKRMMNPNSYLFDIQGAKVEGKQSVIRVNCHNVHGNVYTDIIFGIDQKKIGAVDPQYPFTKTYRKLLHSVGGKNISLPTKSRVKKIIFYGHSLAPADYSYYQSIFDYYSIYDSNVKLIFIFSEYHQTKRKNHEEKVEKINSISKLLRDYGESMDNKNKGENLLHKLQLENRIEIKTKTLTAINVKNFMEIYEVDFLKKLEEPKY